MIKKINKFINEKIILIFTIFLFIQPVLDVFAGIMLHSFSSTFTFSSIIRMLFLIFMMYYIIFVKKTKYMKFTILLFCYSILFCIFNLIFKNDCSIFLELKYLFNNIYMPISIIFLLDIFEERKFDIKKLYIVLLIYMLLVFIPNLFNIGFNSYAYSKEGSAGFFYSANALGSIISIIIPVFIGELIKKKNKIYLILFLIMYIYILFTLGTKAPLLCALIIFIYYFVLSVTKMIKNKSYKKLIVLSLSFILLVIIFLKIIKLTPFYDNLLIHLNFLKIEKFSDLLTFKNIDHFIFSSRLSFFKDSFNIFMDSNIFQKLFGIGYVINSKVLKLAEMDYLDTFIHQGILGFIIIYYIYFKLIFNICLNYFSTFKINFLNIEKSSMIISIIISVLCALLTGHVLATPAVAIFVSLTIVIFYNRIKGE